MKKLLLLTTAIIAAASPAHADPITAAVAWVGSTLAAGGVAAFALNTALSLGLSAISQALFKPPRPPVSVEFDVQMGDDLPLSFIAGDYITAGKRKYLGSWGKNTQYITEVVEVSSLPQSGLTGMWVNDEVANILWGETDTDGTPYNLGNPLTNYEDDGKRIWVRWVNGTQTVADPMLVALFGADPNYPWTAAMVGRGKSYAIVTTRYDSETLTSYPSYLFQPTPIAFYDLRLDSTNGGSGAQRWDNPSTWAQTRNPAVIAYNIARGVYYGTEWVYGGKNLPAWRLPSAEWIAAANACAATVSKSGGGTEPRYRCGLEISVDTPAADVLEEIGKSANMRFAEVGGRIKPLVDLPGAAVFSFTDGDILITEGQSFKPFFSVSETYNTISATYPEPGEKWVNKDAPEFVDTVAKAQHKGRHLPVAMSYPAVPYGGQVQRLMRSQMKDYQRQREHEFYLPPDAYALEPGVDMVSFSSDRNGYVNKLFTVQRVTRVPGMNVLVSLREVDPADYDWSAGFEQPTVITPPVNPVPFVQPINGLTVTGTTLLDQSSNSRRPALLVKCNGDEVGVTDIEIEGRVLGQATTIKLSKPFSAPFQWYILDVLRSQTYQVRARLLSDLTPKSAWSAWTNATTPDVGISDSDFEGGIRKLFRDQGMTAIEYLAALPSTGNWLNRTVFLTADGKLYRWNGSTWKAVVEEALAGVLDETYFAAGIKFPKVVSVLPATGTEGDLVTLSTTGLLYRWHAGAWTAGVPAAQINGQLVQAQIAAGAIGADQIATNGLVARHFAVTDFTNYVIDDQIQDPASWSGIGSNVTHGPNYGASVPAAQSRGVWSVAPKGATATTILSKPVPAKPGDQFRAVGRLGSTGSGFEAYTLVQFLDMTNSLIGGAVFSPAKTTGAWGDMEVAGAVAPAGTAYVDFGYHVPASKYGGATIIFSAPELRRKLGGNAVIDGTLTGDKLVANTITAGLLATSGLITFAAQIEQGLIGSVHIADVIQSTNFVAGQAGAGWRIQKNGIAEFNDVIIRRQIAVASGSVSIGNTVMPTPGGVTPFRTYQDGPAASVLVVTDVPMAAWRGTYKTYLAVGGMQGATVTTDGTATGNELWGWVGEVAALTKWSGAQYVRLAFKLMVEGKITGVSAHTLLWTLYEVS